MSGWKWITTGQKRQQELTFWEQAKASILAKYQAASSYSLPTSLSDFSSPGRPGGIRPQQDDGGFLGRLGDVASGIKDKVGDVWEAANTPLWDEDKSNDEVGLPWNRHKDETAGLSFADSLKAHFGQASSGEQFLGGYGIDTSGLPDEPYLPLRQAVDVAASPLTWGTLGSGGLGQVGARGVVKGLATQAAKETAIGTAGYVTQQQTQENLPEWVPEPIAQILSFGTGAAAGLLTHQGIKHAPSLGEELATGRLSSERGSFDPNEIRRNSPGIPESSIVEPVSSGGAGVVSSPTPPATGLPEPGYSLADEMIAQKDATIAHHPVADKLPSKMRAVAGAVDSSINTERSVVVGNAASHAGRRVLLTHFDSVMAPVTENLKTAWKNFGSAYIGPDDNPFKGSLKDRADNPEFYLPDTPEFAHARQAFSDAQDQQVTMAARTQTGADVKLYDSEKPGSFYLPTQKARDSIDSRIQSTHAALGSASKSRAYEGAYQRWKNDPSFVPDMDVDSLVTTHNEWAASRAANSILKRAVPGKTRIEAVSELKPQLAARREELMRWVSSLQGKLQRAEQTARVYDSSADELARYGESMRNNAPDEDFSPLETALRNGARRLDKLNIRRDLKQGEVASLRAELEGVRDDLHDVRKAFDAVDLSQAFQRSPATNLYHTPEVAKALEYVTRRPTGPLAGVVRVMDEWRATHLSSDLSPVSIQNALAIIYDPVQAARTFAGSIARKAHLAKSERGTWTGLEEALANEPSRVADFEFHTGQSFRAQNPEFSAARMANGGKTLLARIPWLGDKLQAMESGLFAGVQSYAYEAWKASSDYLMDVNKVKVEAGTFTRAMADAEAAAGLGRWVPHLNLENRGISPGSGRAAFERGVLSSPSFAATPALLLKDATSGIEKLMRVQTMRHPGDAFRTLTGREQLALRQGVRAVGFTATAVATSVVATSVQRGDSPEKTLANIQEALFDPSSRKYWAFQIPGTDRVVPVPGPIRSFAKLIMPSGENGMIPFANLQSFTRNKLSAPAGLAATATSVLTGNEATDWKGDRILEGDAAEKVARGVAYLGEQVAPTSIGAVSSGVREGDSPADTAEQAAGQFLGSNISAASPKEQLDDIAKERGVSEFRQLPTKVQQQIKEQHPDLWAEYQARQSDATKKYYDLRDIEVEDQQKRDGLLASGKLTNKKWIDEYHSALDRMAGAGAALFEDRPPRDAHERYIQTINDSKKDGVTDWDAVDTWLDAQSAADQRYIQEHASIPWTPTVAEYKAASKSRSAMYALPKYVGFSGDDAFKIDSAVEAVNSRVRKGATVGEKLAALAKVTDLTPAQRGGVTRAIYGTLTTTPARANYKKAHPEISKWFD